MGSRQEQDSSEKVREGRADGDELDQGPGNRYNTAPWVPWGRTEHARQRQWPSRSGGAWAAPDESTIPTAAQHQYPSASGPAGSAGERVLFRDTHGRRVVRWPRWPPWGRARLKAAALEGVQPSWLHVSGLASRPGSRLKGGRGLAGSSLGCWTPAPVWLDSEYCLVADTDVELLALSRTGLQAVPEAGERRGDAFGRYRMSPGGTSRLTSFLVEGRGH